MSLWHQSCVDGCSSAPLLVFVVQGDRCQEANVHEAVTSVGGDKWCCSTVGGV